MDGMALKQVVLNAPTLEVLNSMVEEGVGRMPAVVSGAVGAALVRGKYRPGTDNMVYDTLLTDEEIEHVWSVLALFAESDPMSKASDDPGERAWIVNTVAAVNASMAWLKEVRHGDDPTQLVFEPKKRQRRGWRRR